MEFLTEEGYPDYSHPLFNRDNPCHRNFVDCEGDCRDCPNKEFFARFDEEKNQPLTYWREKNLLDSKNTGGIGVPVGNGTRYHIAVRRLDGSYCDKRIKENTWLGINPGERWNG